MRGLHFIGARSWTRLARGVVAILALGACREASKTESESAAPPVHSAEAAPAVSQAEGSHAGGASASAPSASDDRVGPPWAAWPMPNSPASGLPNAQSYDTSIAGTVLDRVTGLMWQRTVDDANGTFEDAAPRCQRLVLGGFKDWRLPSRIELVSILDVTQSQPSIHPKAFPKTPSDWFWTSSIAAESPTAAWYVYFYFGYPKTDERSNQFRTRCVRTAKPAAPALGSQPHYALDAAVVHDQGTGLTWQRAIAARTFDFAGAQRYCAEMDLGGRKDWRVPSLLELLTLVDERKSNPSIDASAFPGTPEESFWTSSAFVGSQAEAWHVYFDHGNALYGLLNGTYRVRCVR